MRVGDYGAFAGRAVALSVVGGVVAAEGALSVIGGVMAAEGTVSVSNIAFCRLQLLRIDRRASGLQLYRCVLLAREEERLSHCR